MTNLKFKPGFRKPDSEDLDKIRDALDHVYDLRCIQRDTATTWLRALMRSVQVHCFHSMLAKREILPPQPGSVMLYIENHMTGGSLRNDPVGVSEYMDSFRQVKIIHPK